MKLHVEWRSPTPLRDATQPNMIYDTEVSKLPEAPGVYILGRQWGNSYEALYVGKANDIRARVKGQLNNLRVMQHLRNAKSGKRIILAGKMKMKPGQQLKKSLALVERTLIRHFLSEGHDLVNKQGTRIRRHEIVSSGSWPKRFIPGAMYFEKAKGE